MLRYKEVFIFKKFYMLTFHHHTDVDLALKCHFIQKQVSDVGGKKRASLSCFGKAAISVCLDRQLRLS